MRKKDLFLYLVVLILIISFIWQWVSKNASANQIIRLNKQQNYYQQLSLLSGIGALGSKHIHSDIKIYINGNAIDFSERKYQIASSYIHFEDGIGDVVHIHATGLTLGHLFRSLGMDLNSNCIVYGGKNYCTVDNNKLRFYVNGVQNNEFNNYIFHDLDKILVSYGNENISEIQNQVNSVTNLAPKYSSDKKEME